MSSNCAIKVENVSKCYHIFSNSQDRLKQLIIPGNKKYYREFWALHDISFQINKGESIGIIGRNGSGKSTLLQIIAGTLTQTSGSIHVDGRVAALLELGSGFNPEYTGKENVYLNGNILGISKKKMDQLYDEIIEFADIGDFINQPVKTYSSGMIVRLAFAVQACIEPDILIVDEALAVGDVLFQKKCFARMKALAEKGTTLLFVTHDIELVRTFTSRAILLEKGKIIKQGPSAEVVLEYRNRMHQEESAYYQKMLIKSTESTESNSEKSPLVDEVESNTDSLQKERQEFGDKEVAIYKVAILNEKNEECSMFYPKENIKIDVYCKAFESISNLNIGIRIRNKMGVKMYSWGTLNQDISIWSGNAGGTPFWNEEIKPGETLKASFLFNCNLGMDLYEVQAYVTEEKDKFFREQKMLHWIDEAAHFQVNIKQQEYYFGGASDLRMKVEIESSDKKVQRRGFVV